MKHSLYILLICFVATNICKAGDDAISNSIIDALLKTRTTIEQENLSESSLINGDSLSPRYRDLVPKPHKYYVKSMVYGSMFEERKGLHVDDWEKTQLPSSVIDYFKDSNIIISDSIQKISESNLEIYNKSPGNEREKLVPTAIYEILEVSGVSLYKNNLYVSVQYCISDNFGRTLRREVLYLYAYTLSENNVWEPVSGYYREVNNDRFVKFDNNFDPKHEFDIPYNILTRIIPFAYSKFQSDLQKSDEYSHLLNSVLSSQDSTYYPRITTLSRYNDEITHPFYGRLWEDEEYFQDMNLSPYQSACFFLNYIQAPISDQNQEMVDSLKPYNGTEFKYIMGNPVIKLDGNRLSVGIIYFQCDKVAFADDDKYKFSPQSILMTPILSYNCIFKYDEEKGEWLFAKDEITQSHNSQIYAKKSDYYYF